MKENSNHNNFNENKALSNQEALDLANELKTKLSRNETLLLNQKIIYKIIAGLSDKRGLIRRTFSESLGRIGNGVLPELKTVLLKSKSVIARRAAAKTIKLIGDPSALPYLLEALLNDEDPVVQGSSVGAMAIFGEDAIHHLIQVLEHPKSSEMQCGLASWGIAFVGANGSEALKKAAISDNPMVRASAIAALEEQIRCLEDEGAKNILSNALNDTSGEVQIEAIKLIGRLNEKEWDLNQLASKLNSQMAEIRKQTSICLMKLNAVSQLKKLQHYIAKEKDEEVIKIMQLSINKLSRE